MAGAADQGRAWILPGTGRSPVQPNDAAGNRLVGLSLRFWILVVLTGVGTGLGAGLLMRLLRLVQHAFYHYRAGDFLAAVEHVSPLQRVAVLLAAGAVTIGGNFLLSHTRGGSGGKLNERIWFHSGRLAEFKTIAQSALSMVIVGMGASIGRETAPKQTGAAIASLLSRHASLSSAECRLLAACGAGAGMGAVYNVPLGGALFALEVLLGTLALPLIPPALATSFIATATGWLLLPNQPTYAITSYPMTLTQLVFSLGFGPLAGIASVLWVRMIVVADAIRPRGVFGLATPIVVFGLLGLLAIPFPQLLGNGKDVAQICFTGGLSLPLLAALVMLKPMVTAACLGSGAPGGLFTPSVALGALFGALLGQLWSLLWPGAAPGSYAMIGAAAILAASMQAPIAAIVLLLELTHHIQTLMVPILIATAGAAVTARRLDPRSVYSGRVHTGRRAAATKPPAVELSYAHLLKPEVETISVAANYPEVLERLAAQAARPRPLYVLDEEARLAGRIEATCLDRPHALTQVLSSAAAGDLMERVAPLDATMSETDALARLRAEPAGELPVIDPASGRLLGVAVRP
jgi:H+/Cl- antiporter ClcA